MFTTADLCVHVTDPSVHDAPISVFTMGRSQRSRCSDFRSPHAKPPGGYPCGNAYYQQLASDTERGPFVFISFEGVESGAYDRGPEPHEEKPGKPEESALGLKGKDRRSYLAASASDQLRGSLAQTNHEVRVLLAWGSVASAMVHMADSPALDALWILDGEKWYRAADTWDENGEPVCLVDDSVNVVQPTLLSNYRRPEVFRAWLRGLLLVSQDPIAAEECIVSASESDWKALMDRWADFRVTIAERALQELARDQTVSPDERGKPLDELFERAREGDTAASRALESRAVEEKNVMLWRFARAISDGKRTVAKMYASRVHMNSTEPR